MQRSYNRTARVQQRAGGHADALHFADADAVPRGGAAVGVERADLSDAGVAAGEQLHALGALVVRALADAAVGGARVARLGSRARRVAADGAGAAVGGTRGAALRGMAGRVSARGARAAIGGA